MTCDMETIEGNKLIAQFMGAKYINTPVKTKDEKGNKIVKDFWYWTRPDNNFPLG